MVFIVDFILVIHLSIGRFIVAILPMYWAYNVAQRGDSFGYALLTYFGNVVILGFIWYAIYWVLEKISIAVHR